jgi:two-component system, OmpR family, phosphate regulon sensor histidine kinase PhoR
VARDPYEDLRAGFTAAVSHELRTPLARLLALIESASLPGGDPAKALEQARAEVELMDELIDDVLFLSELETGRQVVSLGSTEAAPLVREIVSQLAESAERAGVTVQVAIEDDALELPVRARILRVVVENLLLNAIRYAGDGATAVVELAREDGRRVLAVRDDGAGVDPSDLPRLFERFYRADRSRATRGSGLGLAIVKHVVESAGGRVEARGAPAAGLEIRSVFP